MKAFGYTYEDLKLSIAAYGAHRRRAAHRHGH